jgi:hypothetical protein
MEAPGLDEGASSDEVVAGKSGRHVFNSNPLLPQKQLLKLRGLSCR